LRSTKAHILNLLGKKVEAEAEYRHLMEINPDAIEYHDGLRLSLTLTPDQEGGTFSDEQLSRVLALYDSLVKQYPKSSSATRFPLNFIKGNNPLFRVRVDAYLKRALRKGVPSLFRDLRPLYNDVNKTEVIEKLINGYLVNLRKEN